MTESRHDVVVVGGGPAGSTAAAAAARAGLDVLLLEAGSHPRSHVGESLLPGIIPILADIDALTAVEAAGFGRKTGSTLWHWGMTPKWDLWFADSDAYDAAWLVERARFDAILFDAARRAGARIHERAQVRELLWEGSRVLGVRWQAHDDAEVHVASARFVVDASGQSAIVARALDLREPIEGLRHQAMWAHFDGAEHLPEPRHEQAFFVAESNQWWWAFPLGNGRTSVGVVQLDAGERRGPPRPDLDAELARSELAVVLGPRARRVTQVRSERDWSYRMRDVAGAGWLAVGDAAGFIDPVLSTGVMLALHSGWHASRCVRDVIGGAAEDEALGRYRDHHRTMFGDLLRMVRFYYQQNLHRDDYFWESKRILMTHDTELRPQKAFVVLTSGLIQNLALDETKRDADAHREQLVTGARRDCAPDDPTQLGFVCVHLRMRGSDEPAMETSPAQINARAVYVLIEPADPATPALFRTRNFHVNAIAPRLGNDPISIPALAPILRDIAAAIADADGVDGDDLAGFWRRNRARLAARLRALPPEIELVRVFGE